MRDWLSDPLPLVAWLPSYLVASVCAGVLAYIFSRKLYGRQLIAGAVFLSVGALVFVLFGNRLVSGAVFLAFLIAFWFQDPPAQ